MSRLEIDLNAIDANVAALQKILGPDTAICGVVKKDAYGLGAVTIAHRLVKAGCSMLCVYGPEEAEQLVQGAVTAPILMTYPLRHLGRTDSLYRPAVAERLHLTIHDPQQLKELDAIGRTFGIRLPVHLYIDTGMARGGLNPQQFSEAITSQSDRRYQRIAGIYTHFATADSDPKFLEKQQQRLDELLEQHRSDIPSDCIIHMANTHAVLRDTSLHRSMVRPGLSLYGFGTADFAGKPPMVEPMPKLRGVVRWISRVIHVQDYPRHTRVGYQSMHRTEKKTTLGLVPVGYGDGYPLALSDKAQVRVRIADRWHKCPVLGRISMDQITIDLTAAVAEVDVARQAAFDAEVEVLGNDPDQPNHPNRLAALAGCHVYELLCRLHPGLPRKYLQ